LSEYKYQRKKKKGENGKICRTTLSENRKNSASAAMKALHRSD